MTMPVDPKSLKESAKGHEKRMESEWWSPADKAPPKGESAWEAVEGFEDPASASVPPSSLVATPPWAETMMNDVADLRRSVVAMGVQPPRPVAPGAVPAWLVAAAGDPLDYDGPNPSREGVGWRVVPEITKMLKAAQKRLGLRTLAGAIEYVFRLGLAAVSRIPRPT